jgi:hypothetical protein
MIGGAAPWAGFWGIPSPDHDKYRAFVDVRQG